MTELKSARGEKKRERCYIQGEIPSQDNKKQIFQHKLSRPEENRMTYSNTREKITTTKDGDWWSSD